MTQGIPVYAESTGQRPVRRHVDVIRLAAVLLLIVFLIGAVPKFLNWLTLNTRHNQLQHKIRQSNAVAVVRGPGASTLMLPGDTTAVQQIPLNARVDGFLAQRYVDIGDHVKKGQLLAVISTPEVDQQVAQAEGNLSTQQANYLSAIANYRHFLAAQHAAAATVQQARANVAFDIVQNRRYETLAYEGAVSFEVRDTYLRQLRADNALLKNSIENESAANLQTRAALAQVEAARQTVSATVANLNYYRSLQNFKNIYAPYDGVITQRYIDVGQLVAAGGGGTQILAMGALDVLRIFVQVPQTVFRSFRAGNLAEVHVPEFPNRVWKGLITNVSGGLDSTSRTLQVEVRVDNTDLTLPAGVYAQVAFQLPQTIQTYTIPVNAITSRSNGNYIAVMRNGRAYFQPITIYRDYGPTVEVQSGVGAGDAVLLDPPDDLKDGEQVHATLVPASEVGK